MMKHAKVIFIIASIFSVLAIGFGIFILFANRLPEGVLIIGLGFCIFGTAGLFVTSNEEEAKEDDSDTKVSIEGIEEDNFEDNIYKIYLSPEGEEPVLCDMAFDNECFVADNGDETLELPYSEVKKVRFKSLSVYIDWKDNTTWVAAFKDKDTLMRFGQDIKTYVAKKQKGA